MKPLIGITTSTFDDEKRYYQWKDYVEAVEDAGGVPLLLVPTKAENIEEIVERIDGLLLSGGWDIDPTLYGEEPKKVRKIDSRRDTFEIPLTKMVYEKNKPILGICRGAQVLNVTFGGTLHQQINTEIKHFQQASDDHPTHTIQIEEGTLLFNLLKVKETKVNSFHHQAIAKLAPGFSVNSRAKDKIIEGIEDSGKRFVIGVQFHIEGLYKTYPSFFKIFKAFVESIKHPSQGFS